MLCIYECRDVQRKCAARNRRSLETPTAGSRLGPCRFRYKEVLWPVSAIEPHVIMWCVPLGSSQGMLLYKLGLFEADIV